MQSSEREDFVEGSYQRILIVYQDLLLRDLLEAILLGREGVQVVHSSHVDRFSKALIEEHQPDVIVADRMPASSTIQLLNMIGDSRHHIRLVTVSLVREELYVIEVQGHRQINIEDFVIAVRGNRDQTER